MSQPSGLDTPIRFLRGVGPRRAEHFHDIGIESIRDLLDFFPRRHRFYEPVESIASLKGDQEACIAGKIESVDFRPFPRPPRILVTVADDSGQCEICWFNCPYLLDRFQTGNWIRVRGRVRLWKKRLRFSNPKFELFPDAPGPMGDHLSLPVYPTHEQFGDVFFSRLIQTALDLHSQSIDDWFDSAYLEHRDLIDRRQAYQRIHTPQDYDQWLAARRRLAYDELLIMQLGVLLTRAKRRVESAVALKHTDQIDQRIRRRFPFTLTGAQDRVVGHIVADLCSGRPMCRLIQGDVGCGKTVVGLYAALVTVANRRQVAFMAPTEILARQHYDKISDYLAESNVRVALLVGGTAKKERQEIVTDVASGQIDILIGTHALIERDVAFARLALVIIDEQHKFGVHQRSAIQSKGPTPHYLVMTATPIPRSLALTVFGDLDLSIIDEHPPGKVPTKTYRFAHNEEDQVYRFLTDHLKRGDQGYVVYPLLEESEKLELKSARRQAEQLAAGPLSKFRVELIHGRMTPTEKQTIMADFRRRKIDVLVATVVIEVGIDVPDANVLVIEHAERFGLAQLHQLRGRIGRAGGQGHCLLMCNARSEPARRRLDVLLNTTDGFKIAEEDLRIRGPGQFFGTAQHGLPELKLADLIDDYPLLLQARQDAEQILRDDPQLSAADRRAIRDELIRRLGEKLKLIEAA